MAGALIAGLCYDPATSVAANAHALSAMTAFDTTNLRLTFSPPASGNVHVRIVVPITGSTTASQVLLGVLSGATVIGRMAPMLGQATNVTNSRPALEVNFVVSGLSGSQTWDAAYAVQVVDGSTACTLNYGGPNDTTTSNAWGGFRYEIWDATNCLANALYDPTTAASKATTSNLAMTAFDTTNLRLTFTAPASGNVWCRIRAGAYVGNTGEAGVLLGVLDGATVRGRIASATAKLYPTTPLTTTLFAKEGDFLVTGLTPGNSYTWDAAYGVEITQTSSSIKYGGPNNASGANAYGAFSYEIWRA